MVGLSTAISAALGGIFGLGQKWLAIKEEKIKAEERAKEREHELSVMDKEAEYAEKKLRIEQEIVQSQMAGAAFTASQQYGNASIIPEGAKLTKNQTWWLVVIEAVSRAIRPTTTIYYQILTAVVFTWAAITLAHNSEPQLAVDTAKTIVLECVYTILDLGVMCVSWWFGVSSPRQKRK